MAVIPLLALTAVTVSFWAEDRSAKSGSAARAFAGLTISIVGLIGLVLLVNAGLLGAGKTGQLLLRLFGSALALSVLPRKYLAMVRPVGGLVADRLSGVKVLLVLLIAISLCNFAFVALMPSIAGGIALLVVLYFCVGLGNGATFQLVPHRWRAKTGGDDWHHRGRWGYRWFLSARGVGHSQGEHWNPGSYQLGFATFGVLAAVAFILVVTLQRQ